jgi:hypothetical protein
LVRATSEQNAGESPLVGVRYPVAAMSLWRWWDAPEDDVVTAMLARCAKADQAERTALRDTLTVEDFFTLVTYAQRCVLAALRAQDAERVAQGWAALALIDLDRCADPRDVWMAARLVRYATDRIAADPEAATRQALDQAHPDTAELLAEIMADEEPDLTQDCGMREVHTAGGPILVDDDDDPYLPNADLVEIALRLTAVLAEHGYTHAGITVATAIGQHWLADVMTGPVRIATSALTGCVSVHADPADDRSNALLVFVGEAATPDDATMIATRMATTKVADSPILGRCSGRLCAVLVTTRRHSQGHGGTTREILTPLAEHIELLLRAATS